MSDRHPHELLGDFKVVVPIVVQWGDADMLAHINNIVFFRWYETARIEYFQRIGLWESEKPLRVGPILASISCNFRQQVSFPDTVRVGCRVTRIGRSSMTLEYKVYSEAQEQLVADGESVVVCFDYAKNESHPVPDPIRTAIETLEGTTF